MIQGRTMDQFITLPDGTLLVVNGTAGYAQATSQTPLSMTWLTVYRSPLGLEFTRCGPIDWPVICNQNAPAGNLWSNTGLPSSNVARSYHSSAILLSDDSIVIAGPNPDVDSSIQALFAPLNTKPNPNPPYFSAITRHQPSGIPTTLSYGGQSFNFTIPAT